MALDGIFLYHLKNEIASFAVDSRVDKIHQPSRDEIVISLRSREGSRKLLMSCNADSARIHFTEFAPENPPKPPMFCLMLRKRLTGAWITSIEQDNLERILRINFSGTDELGDKTNYALIIEIMGKYSNIIFVDRDNRIIDSLKRVDESKSHIREILPGVTYVAPPAQDKLNIFTDDISVIKEKIAVSNKGIYKAFLETVKGVSPIVCREIENGLSLEEFKKMAENPVPTAVIVETPKDFTFIDVKQYGNIAEIKTYESFSKLLDFFYYEKVRLMRIKARSSELFKALTTLQERAVRKAVNRQNELDECRDKETYKLFGDLISANQYRLEKGVPYYDLENYYDDNKIIRIPADVTMTPSQNSQKYYKEYRKKQIAESKLNDFISQAKAEADYFDTVIDELSRAKTDSEISEIKEELAAGGYIKRGQNKNKNTKSLKPMQFKTRDGFNVLVGRNNLMNDRLTLKTAKNYDTWFHVQDTAGSHVICETSGTEITDTAIHDCAVIAAYFSKARESSNVAVDYTLIKNVKKPNGAKPGYVIYDPYKTEYVTPTLEETEGLRNE
ncbi:MAG: NFACT RNA binding domain-containing protein [Eubacteriales bacterium]|nr:NFACT RNA binding domain-containing protein [Eubacteriales bacterium]